MILILQNDTDKTKKHPFAGIYTNSFVFIHESFLPTVMSSIGFRKLVSHTATALRSIDIFFSDKSTCREKICQLDDTQMSAGDLSENYISAWQADEDKIVNLYYIIIFFYNGIFR